MPTIAHTLARSDDFATTGTYWVLDSHGHRLGSVRRVYPGNRATWRYQPVVSGTAVDQPQKSLAAAAAIVAGVADTIRRRHAAGDHAACSPGACLAARRTGEGQR